ncbi:TPA: DUF2007 domain-containing protein [Klebsiella oxytoca]|uniref:DUF2007 domain-containing protein n=1 Tax=Klebsiella oxytoca TaxID=571 RepID=A0AAN5L983_KLEOX|nr:DUF2007 domain-containing protein [Klebsiella oxytoca]HAT1685563.1 DUF2007 domain-containing protein [Klebsiella oxytoca]
MWNIQPARGEFILLAQSLSPPEASIVAGRLEAEGIAVMLLDEHVVWNNPLQAQAVGGVKLLVKQPDRAAARRVPDNIRRGEYCRQGEHDPDGEGHAAGHKRGRVLLNVVIIIILFIFPAIAILRQLIG